MTTRRGFLGSLLAAPLIPIANSKPIYPTHPINRKDWKQFQDGYVGPAGGIQGWINFQALESSPRWLIERIRYFRVFLDGKEIPKVWFADTVRGVLKTRRVDIPVREIDHYWDSELRRITVIEPIPGVEVLECGIISQTLHGKVSLVPILRDASA